MPSRIVVLSFEGVGTAHGVLENLRDMERRGRTALAAGDAGAAKAHRTSRGLSTDSAGKAAGRRCQPPSERAY
jgi:hypothetical protein